MRPQTEAFLARVREAEGPAPEAAARVLEAVRTAVATPAAAGPATTLGLKSALKLGGWIAGVAAASIALQPALPAPTQPNLRELPVSPPPPKAVPASLAAPEPEPEVESLPVPPPVEALTRPPLRARKSPSLRAELSLLAEVHAALRRGDGADALRRLDTHHTRDRRLAAERRAARVFALCAAGRRADAQLAATDFVRRHPTAAQRAAVERACAD